MTQLTERSSVQPQQRTEFSHQSCELASGLFPMISGIIADCCHLRDPELEDTCRSRPISWPTDTILVNVNVFKSLILE